MELIEHEIQNIHPLLLMQVHKNIQHGTSNVVGITGLRSEYIPQDMAHGVIEGQKVFDGPGDK